MQKTDALSHPLKRDAYQANMNNKLLVLITCFSRRPESKDFASGENE
jgi:hypothetical protein